MPNVLLVDDEPMVRGFLATTLRASRFTVVEASGGAEAIARLEAESGTIDAVLSDVVMPGVGGLELAATVHQRWPGIRVLLISAYPLRHSEKYANLPPELPFLQKPFTPPVLLAELARLGIR
jgi:two-component system cell cycle sensor histidine kinase/response regulator CckA